MAGTKRRKARRGTARGRYPGLKASQFGLPGKGSGKTKGGRRITSAQYKQIVGKANRKLYGKRTAPNGRAGSPK